MRGGDHSYPGLQLAAWNITKSDPIKDIFPRNCSNMNSYVLVNAMIYDAHHCQ